jgi:hypothetical protein
VVTITSARIVIFIVLGLPSFIELIVLHPLGFR